MIQAAEIIEIRCFLDQAFQADLSFFEGLNLLFHLLFRWFFLSFWFFFFDFGVSLDIESNLFLQKIKWDALEALDTHAF